MVLLGAGASVEAGIPAAVQLTETLINYFRAHSRTGRVLRYVYGGLMLGKGARGEDPLKGINVEDLIEAVHLLARRKTLQIAPFIALWNEGVTAFQEQDAKHTLMDVLRNVIDTIDAPNAGGERAMKELALNHALDGLESHESQDFAYARNSVVRALIELLWVEEASRVGYLQPLVAQGKDDVLTIASLNYDNTIELACADAGIPCSTGLDRWNNLEGFPAPTTGVDLLKLHGSVTWAKIRKDRVRTAEAPMPRTLVQEQARASIQRGYEPAVIFGAGNKLTAEGPFLELLLAFRERLEAYDELVVIGYSFSDDHINDALWRWINRRVVRRLHVIDFEEDKTVVPFKRLFKKMGDRYTCQVDGAGAGIKEIFAVKG